MTKDVEQNGVLNKIRMIITRVITKKENDKPTRLNFDNHYKPNKVGKGGATRSIRKK